MNFKHIGQKIEYCYGDIVFSAYVETSMGNGLLNFIVGPEGLKKIEHNKDHEFIDVRKAKKEVKENFENHELNLFIKKFFKIVSSEIKISSMSLFKNEFPEENLNDYFECEFKFEDLHFYFFYQKNVGRFSMRKVSYLNGKNNYYILFPAFFEFNKFLKSTNAIGFFPPEEKLKALLF